MTGASRIIDWLTAPYSLYLVLRNNSASQQTKIRAGIILGFMAFYVLNPFDLIPDLHPIIGWLDDLLIMPLGMAVTQRAIPDVNIGVIRAGARGRVKRVVLWTVACAAGLMFIGSLLFVLLIWLLTR